MSRMYFHSAAGDTEVMGTERALMGHLVRQVAEGFLDLPDSVPRLRELVPKDHYLHQIKQQSDIEWAVFFETSFAVSGHGEHLLEWRGRELNPFTVLLNTAILVGSDVVRLAARLHGQCEIHTYVQGHNRAWLADLIDRGLAQGILRDKHPRSDTVSSGWTETVGLLRSRSDIPVVTSYSVCDQFPNASFVPRHDNECVCGHTTLNKLAFGTSCLRCARDTTTITDEEWQECVYEMDHTTMWSRATTELLERERGWLEMKPDNWDSYRFGDGVTVLDLVASDSDKRLEKKFKEFEDRDQ